MSDLTPQNVVYAVCEKDVLDSGTCANNAQAVSRLPEDVFLQVLEIARACPLGSEQPPCTLFLRRVSQVCRYWRRICINNPLLWDCIHIAKFPLRLSRFTDECISRAKDVPVSLSIVPSSNDPKITLSTWKHLLSSLAARGVSAERWKALVLHVSDYRVFLHLFEHLSSHPTPRLEVISCAPRGYYGCVELRPQPSTASTSLSPSLPNLRSLELEQINLRHLFDRQLPVMLTRLTRLNLNAAGLHNYAPDTFVLLLSSSPHLEELSMLDEIVDDYTDNSFNPWSIVTPPITFSSLRRLKCFFTNDPGPTWEGAGLTWVIRFLGSINAPRLQQLVVITPWTRNIIIEQFVDFMSTGYMPNQAIMSEQAPSRRLLYPELRYFGMLSRLLEGAGLHKSELLLAALPSLTHLGICGKDIAVVDRAPQCSPNLTYLSIESPIFSDPKLGDVLHRRQKAGFPIRVVALQPSRFVGLPCDDDASGLPSTVELKSYDRSQVFKFLDL